MNRQEFVAAYREARKVRAFETWAWRLGLIREVISLAFEGPEPAFQAALMSGVGDPLRFSYIRLGGQLQPKLNRLLHCRPVRLPGRHT
jgi:hypothetical protein